MQVINQGKGKVQLLVPILKTQKLRDGRMLIQGVATDETYDKQGEIVDYGYAKAAFMAWDERWPGDFPIREQHDPKKAVGRGLDVIADDEKREIGVKAFVSAAAKDTQTKLDEGILRYFSIGGNAKKRSVETIKVDGEDKKVVRVFLGELSEVSLVDSGANPSCSFTIVKSADGHLESVGLDGTGDEEPEEEITKAAKGIQLVIGFLKGGGSETQSVIFDKENWNAKDAKAWLKENDYTGLEVDETENSLRFRQTDPEKYDRMRTITPGEKADAPDFVAGFLAVIKIHKPHVVEEDGKFKVVDQDGKVYGTHDTKEEADKQLAALYSAKSDTGGVLEKLTTEGEGLMKLLEKYRGQEIDDTKIALAALEYLNSLLTREEGEEENEGAQIEMVRAAISSLKEFIASEIVEEHDKGGDMPSAPMPGGTAMPVQMVATVDDVVKTDVEKVLSERLVGHINGGNAQAVHDHVVKEHGAKCTKEAADEAGDIQKPEEPIIEKPEGEKLEEKIAKEFDEEKHPRGEGGTFTFADAASTAGDRAFAASDKADKSGNKADHAAAAHAHYAAAKAHDRAQEHAKGSSADEHEEDASAHRSAAEEHQKKAGKEWDKSDAGGDLKKLTDEDKVESKEDEAAEAVKVQALVDVVKAQLEGTFKAMLDTLVKEREAEISKVAGEERATLQKQVDELKAAVKKYGERIVDPIQRRAVLKGEQSTDGETDLITTGQAIKDSLGTDALYAVATELIRHRRQE